MPFFNFPYEVFISLLLWCLGLLITECIRVPFKLKTSISVFLYIWHTCFAIIYMFYTDYNIADAKNYYLIAVNSNDLPEFKIGTKFIEYISYIFVNYFKLSWFGIFMLFQLVGFLGLLAFYSSLNEITKYKRRYIKILVVMVVFLPGLNFWSVGLGKEPLSLFSIGFALYASINLKRRYLLMMLSILIMFLIRPHISGLLIISLLVYLLIYFNTDIYTKVIIFNVSLFLIVSFFLNLMKLDFFSVNNYIFTQAQKNQHGGGSVDITQMPYFEQLFTYTFRPLFFDINNIFGFLVSFENLFLLVLFISLIFVVFFKKKQTFESYIVFLLVYILLAWSLLAMTTSNLGISIRQKWMFLPFLIFIIFYYIGKEKRINKKCVE